MMMWLDFFLQAFVQALAWLAAATLWTVIVGAAALGVLKAIGATPKRRARR